MMLSIFQRENTDHRSLGELFYLYVQEVAEITFDHSMKLIMIALLSTVKEFFSLSEEQMSLFVQQFIGNLPNYLRKPLEASGSLCGAAVSGLKSIFVLSSLMYPVIYTVLGMGSISIA